MRRRLLTIIGSAALLAGLTLPTLAQSPADCPDTPPARLTVGSTGRVSSEAAQPLYEEASRLSAVVGQMQVGDVFYVHAGPRPRCVDRRIWFKLRSASGLSGWAIEAPDGAYALEPLIRVPLAATDELTLLEPGAVSFQGVSVTVDPALAEGVWGALLGNEDDETALILPISINLFLAAGADQTEYAGVLIVSPALAVDLLAPGAISAFQRSLAERADEQPLLDSALAEYLLFDPEPVVEASGQYADFENGAGWRALQPLDLDLEGLGTPRMFNYNFVGLTSDSRYLVQAQVLVTAAADASASLPTPESIDALIASLSVAPDALPAEVFSALEATAAWQESPAPTAAVTPAPSDCLLRAVDGRVRIYDRPDTSSTWTGFLFEGTVYYAVELVDNDGLTWYKLADGSILNESMTEFPGWVSDDRVNISGPCNIPGQ